MSQANSKMELFVIAVQELSLARTMEAVMKIVRTMARKLTSADGATVVLRDGDLSYYADEDAISPLWKGSRFPIQTCVSGWAMLNKKAVVIEDIYLDNRVPHDAYRPTFVQSLVMVPIRTIAPIGAIGNYWANRHRATEEEVNLLQSLADMMAVTIERVKVYSELENRVKDRTRELEALNKELESFSYSVSHDLRAPLRAIMGYSKIAIDESQGQLGESTKMALGFVEQNARKMNELIDDLLKFSRLGHKELEKGDLDTEVLVKSILEELGRSAPHDAKITLNQLYAVRADRALLYQVWFNLITNAVKYSSKKQYPVIEITSYKTDNEIVFAIKDNGVGFDMRFADRLFGAFQRLHNEREFKGTGIGLALVQRIINRHGGKVWVNAKVDEGATFSFSLPL